MKGYGRLRQAIVATEPTFTPGSVERLFDITPYDATPFTGAANNRRIDISPDSEQFLM